jgi:hypothetical protein
MSSRRCSTKGDRMGAHKFNPRSIAAQEARLVPEFMLKGGLTARRVLKKQYYLVPQGQSAVAEEILGKEPIFEGSEVDETKLDLVVVLEGVYLEPSVLMDRERTPGAQVGLVEIARVDWCEFKDRAKRTLSGESGVPNFITG